MGCVCFYMKKIELRYWWEYGDEKTRINSLNERRSLIPWGLINQSFINPLFKHVTPRSTEVLVKTCTCMYN